MSTVKKYYTWDEIWEEVADIVDMQDEDFVDQPEAMKIANRAIDEAESLIHLMNEDYFLMKDPLTLVEGTEEYDLPESIFAHKIKKIIYRKGREIYEVTSLKHLSRLLQQQAAIAEGRTSLDEPMQYFLYNATPGSPQIIFTPPPGESGPYITVWHYRNANRLADGSDICDLPEFATFVKAYLIEWMQWKISAGSPRHQTAMAETNNQRSLMKTTLRDMVADGNNDEEMDLSHYEEHN